MRKQNLEGKRFGRLVVVRALPPTIKGERYRWECHCDCGNTTYVQTYNLTSQNTTSCGCVRKGSQGHTQPAFWKTCGIATNI